MCGSATASSSIPGTVAGRTATPLRPGQTVTVGVIVQMVVLPFKGVYSVGASIEALEEPTTLKESEGPTFDPRPSDGFKCWIQKALPGLWKKKGRKRQVQ